jgi:small subunit ribosomal protein S4
LVAKDDQIMVKAKDKAMKKVLDNLELTKERTVAPWLAFNKAELSAKVLRLPEKEDIAHPIQEQLIVELYSK